MLTVGMFHPNYQFSACTSVKALKSISSIIPGLDSAHHPPDASLPKKLFARARTPFGVSVAQEAIHEGGGAGTEHAGGGNHSSILR